MHPSISRCGFFCISTRSLNVPGLGLVGVAAQELVHRALGDEAGLLAHGEAGAAAAPQPGLLELGEHLLGGHVEQCFAQRLVAAQALVDLELVEVGLVDVLQQDARLGGHWSSGSSLARSLTSPPSGETSGCGGPARLRRPRQLVVGVLEPAAGQDRPLLADRSHQLVCVGVVERADVAPVDRGHGGHVARAQALELAHLDSLEASGRAPPRRWRRRPTWRCAGGRRRWCTRTRSAARWAACAACRRRWPPRTGRPGSPASPRPPGRWPAASTSRAPPEPRAWPAAPPSGGRGSGR